MLRVEELRIGIFDSTSAPYLSLQATAIHLAFDLHRSCLACIAIAGGYLSTLQNDLGDDQGKLITYHI